MIDRKVFMSAIGKYFLDKGLIDSYQVSLAKMSFSMYISMHHGDDVLKVRVSDHHQVYDADIFIAIPDIRDMTDQEKPKILKYILSVLTPQVMNWVNERQIQTIFQYNFKPKTPKTLTLYIQENKRSPEVKLEIPVGMLQRTLYDLI